MTMVVRNWRVDEAPGGFRVSADVGDMNVWITLPGDVPPRAAADAFCAIALLPAMARGEDLDLTDMPPLSAGYIERLDPVQEIWNCWNPVLRRIEIRAGIGAPLPATMARMNSPLGPSSSALPISVAITPGEMEFTRAPARPQATEAARTRTWLARLAST